MKYTSLLRTTNYELRTTAGFTLIETFVAITLLTIALVPPMTLAEKSLASAYYSRDQITAFYLAQEAIEAVRSFRDGNILQIAQDTTGTSGVKIFDDIPIDDKPFTVDARKSKASDAIADCTVTCRVLQTDGTLYGYDPLPKKTYFTRTVRATVVRSDGTGVAQEIRVTVTVTWQTGAFARRTFSISENLYRWIDDGAGGT